MLVLSRKLDEALLLDGEISVRVLKIAGSRVQLGIEAPPHIQIQRAELSFDAGELVSDEERHKANEGVPTYAQRVCAIPVG